MCKYSLRLILLVSHVFWIIVKDLGMPVLGMIRRQGRCGWRRRNHAGVKARATRFLRGVILPRRRSVNHHFAAIVETIIILNHVALCIVERGICSAMAMASHGATVVPEIGGILLLSWHPSRSRVAEMSECLRSV